MEDPNSGYACQHHIDSIALALHWISILETCATDFAPVRYGPHQCLAEAVLALENEHPLICEMKMFLCNDVQLSSKIDESSMIES